MNYYPRYSAHYQTKTLHLTMEQDGAYTRLLDWYYANERAIPHAQRYTVARAMTPGEKKSTDAVLREFFELRDEAWHQYRCDAEIEKAQPKLDAARANGRKGGRPRKQAAPERFEETQGKPNGFPVGSEWETQGEPRAKPPQSPIPITPDTSLHTVEIAERPTAAGRACLLMRQAGCVHTNPSHPGLLQALAEGVTPEVLRDTAVEGMEKNVSTPFPWAIATALRRHAAGANQTGANHDQPRESAAARVRRRAEEADRRDAADTDSSDSRALVIDAQAHVVGANG